MSSSDINATFRLAVYLEKLYIPSNIKLILYLNK